jgi:argininosuccinate lyase
MTLQWGGRFSGAPDAELLAFGSSLEDDLVLAPFDVRTSLAHVAALHGGGIVSEESAQALIAALEIVASEIESGSFAASARGTGAEDVHGAIDARVRALEPVIGASLHAGRSRNDQVATTLLLYARDRASRGAARMRSLVRSFALRAQEELAAGTLIASTTHLQPAQPVLLAFWLAAAGESFARAAARFDAALERAMVECPLGSGAVSGSCLPLDRAAAAKALDFAKPSRNAMDAVGSRDVALGVVEAFVHALAAVSRVAAELIVWATPAFGYVRLGDASSTGSSLMPQKRNPDIFELVRGQANETAGSYAGAIVSTIGLPLSYHRDLQQTKRSIIMMCERSLAALDAFERAFDDTGFVRERMTQMAGEGYTVATDIADALIARGVSARSAHAFVGSAVRDAEEQGRALNASDLREIAEKAGLHDFEAPLDARASVEAKMTAGSTAPAAVREALIALLDVSGGAQT